MSEQPQPESGKPHPAAMAWMKRSETAPSAVRPLGRTSPDWRDHKSAAFRLYDAAGPGTSVVAKWHRGATGELERVLYEKILPTLPVPAIDVHGVVEEEEESLWIFLHDIGDDAPSGEAFVRLRTRWLASLHESDLDRWSQILPDGGPSRYRNHLVAARPRLRQGRANPVMTAADRDLLASVLEALDRVEARWSRLEEIADRLPPTIVHGDLKAKNIRPGTDGADLPYVLDWDTVGFGSPAADLESRCTDFDLYMERRSGLPRGVTCRDVRSTGVAGELFRLVAAIDWAGHWLPLPDPQRSLRHLRLHLERLHDIEETLDS